MMDFKAISASVSQFSPLLGSVITEANPIAGLIIMAIAKLFNTKANADEITQAINKDDSAAIKLQQLENEHEDALLQNQVEDVKSAREREEKIVAITGKRDWIVDVIALLVIVGFFFICIINHFINLTDDHAIAMLIGQVSSGFMVVLAYYFGSSNK